MQPRPVGRVRRRERAVNGPFVVGIDLSSRAVDLVRLDENNDEAEWVSVPLVGQNAWDRTRTIPSAMPAASWWSETYLVAIEQPFGPSRLAQSVLMRAQGAILASIPDRITVWEVRPEVWKKHVGVAPRDKPSWSAFPPSFFDDYWPQDARDALGVALYARGTNAAGIAAALNPPKGQAA